MKILLNKKSIIFSLILSAFFVSVAYAQSVSDIKYPIKELGDCGSKEECKNYCDEEKNITACRVFARKNQLKSSEGEKKFEVVNEDGGPGGCAKEGDDPISSCSNYCDDTAHMKECVAYAKTHSLMDGEHLTEAEKVISALERGAKLPDGCKNKKTCERVCEDPANVKIARQCFAFAKEAGLLPPEVSDEQAEKMFKAIEEGRAPFKSPKEFEKCENPQSEEIMEKCINFALENGFLSREEAEMIKKTGGKGPGGCRGKQQCEAYCEANREECVAFTEKNGLMSDEQKAQMEEGKAKFKEGFNKAPEEVKECLRSSIGREKIEEILAGSKSLNKTMGESMRACFDKQRENYEGTFPPELQSCIELKIGSDGLKKLIEEGPTPELDEKMRSCFEIRNEEGGFDF